MLPAWSFCKFSAFVHSFSREHVNQAGRETPVRVHTQAHARTHAPKQTKLKPPGSTSPGTPPPCVSRPAEMDFRRANHLSTLQLAHCSDFAGVSFFTQRSCQAPARHSVEKPTPCNLPPRPARPLVPAVRSPLVELPGAVCWTASCYSLT